MPEDNSPFLPTTHRPRPKPATPWRLRQRWSRLLFAHWPMPPESIQAKLPGGLQVDTLDGAAWLGVVPFTMDRVRFRTAGEHSVRVPTAHTFPELNLRTYVTGTGEGKASRPGVYFFSLDAGSLLAVLGARRFGAIQAGEIHHQPWQLEDAEAELQANTLPQSFGFTLPNRPPILHYSSSIEMEAWTLRRTRAR